MFVTFLLVYYTFHSQSASLSSREQSSSKLAWLELTASVIKTARGWSRSISRAGDFQFQYIYRWDVQADNRTPRPYHTPGIIHIQQHIMLFSWCFPLFLIFVISRNAALTFKRNIAPFTYQVNRLFVFYFNPYGRTQAFWPYDILGERTGDIMQKGVLKQWFLPRGAMLCA